MSEAFETLGPTPHGLTLEKHYDDDPVNPREDYDHAGSMVCWHSRYNLGDPGLGYRSRPINGASRGPIEFETPEDFRLWWKKHGKGGILLPLHLYDHSGLTISHGSFSCPWDSGQVGYHYITADKIREEWGGKSKRLTKKARARAQKCLEAELSEYDSYLTGQVFGFKLLNALGDEINSCWGFIGSDYFDKECEEVLALAEKEAAEEADTNALLTFTE